MGVFVYVYYSMSVASVTSLAFDQVLADRNFVSGTFPNRNTTFIVEVQVWSKAQSLSVRLDNPVFLVRLSPSVKANETLPSGTIQPGSYLTYNLRLNTNESRDALTISFPNATVSVELTSTASSGLYSQTITLSHLTLWDWTTATIIKDYG